MSSPQLSPSHHKLNILDELTTYLEALTTALDCKHRPEHSCAHQYARAIDSFALQMHIFPNTNKNNASLCSWFCSQCAACSNMIRDAKGSSAERYLKEVISMICAQLRDELERGEVEDLGEAGDRMDLGHRLLKVMNKI